MPSRPLVLAVVALLAFGGACSKADDGGDREAGGQRSTAAADGTTSSDDTAPVAADGSVGTGPTTTLGGPLGNIKPPETAPAGDVEVKLSRAVAGTASGKPEVRCVTGKGFFDVVLSFEASPRPLNPEMGLVSLSFGAPGFKGPGKYGVDGNAGAYGVLVEDTKTKEGFEFFAPDRGLAGSVEIGGDAKSGKFDVRGLVDIDARPLDVSGSFTCGSVEQM